MKTIDVTAMEWFDKANGNSYFSGRVVVDYGTPDEKVVYLPFQYGYGDHYLTEAASALDIDAGSLSIFCRDNGIILRIVKRENCLKRDTKRFGTA